jgi:hypothetical protein
MILPFTRSRLPTKALAVLLLLVAVAISGCYQPVVAPATTYNEDDAKFLKEELAKIEWE